MAEQAKRYNAGKPRYGLVPTSPIKSIVDVYTEGAHKYTVYGDEEGNRVLGKDIPINDVAKKRLTVIESGADNWRKGQGWLECMESVERHITAWKNGEDLDPDLKTKHLANAGWGLLALMEFEKTHPEFDNRNHLYLQRRKIGLDVDEVLADFIGAMMLRFPEIKTRPVYWNDPLLSKRFSEVANDIYFWMSIPVKVNPLGLPFEPHCYITSRTVPSEVTMEWLDIYGFPKAPVYTVGHNNSKLDIAKSSGIEIFVDDRFETFVELNKGGVCTYLMDAAHNQRYDVGYKRIKDLKELV
jgi:hypothetical protein